MSAKQQNQAHKSTEEKRVSILNGHGEELVGILHETGSHEVVIICHGFQSSKDRIPMVTLAFAFEQEGISAFRFDFTGNGESEGSFQYGNYREEADDIRSAVEHFQKERRHILALVGHSKGGIDVILYASRYADVQTIVNISGRFDLTRGIEGRLGPDFRKQIELNGFIDVKNRKGEVKYQVTKESLMARLTTDPRAACETIPESIRVITVHGTADELSPVEDAIEFDRHIRNHDLRIVEGADHEFTKHQTELISHVVSSVKAAMCTNRCLHRHVSLSYSYGGTMRRNRPRL